MTEWQGKELRQECGAPRAASGTTEPTDRRLSQLLLCGIAGATADPVTVECPERTDAPLTQALEQGERGALCGRQT